MTGGVSDIRLSDDALFLYISNLRIAYRETIFNCIVTQVEVLATTGPVTTLQLEAQCIPMTLPIPPTSKLEPDLLLNSQVRVYKRGNAGE